MMRMLRALLIPVQLLLLVIGFGTSLSGRGPTAGSAGEFQPQPRSSSAMRVEEGFVPTRDGVRLYYQKAGTGGRTVIVPGRLFLFEQMKRLADRHTVISYDMRNRGRSDAVADDSRIAIQEDIRDLETVRQHFKVQKFVAVGYSYLGLMVALYAMEHPQTIERMVQLGPVPLKFGTEYPAHLTASRENTGADPADVEKLRRLEELGYAKTDPKELCEAQWSVRRYGLVGNPANVGKLGSGGCEMPNEWPVNLQRHFQHHFTSVQKLDESWEKVARIVVHPVLTIHGTKDRNAPYGAGREWAMKLPNARLLTVREGAHQAFAEYPEIVIPAMRAFLEGRWPHGAEKVTAYESAAWSP